MQQWRKPDLGINHAVFDELPEYIFGNQTQGILGLHELKTLGRAGKEVRQVRAARRRDVIALILLARDGGRQSGNRLVAQRAVQMKMQFNFGKSPKVHLLTITRG